MESLKKEQKESKIQQSNNIANEMKKGQETLTETKHLNDDELDQVAGGGRPWGSSGQDFR